MKETGVVHTVGNDEALVRLKRHTACLGCRACSISSGGEMLIKAAFTDKIQPGDRVSVEIDSISFLKAVVMIYLFPTAAFLAGILAGLRISPLLGINEHKELLSIIVGVALLLASLVLARSYGLKRRNTYKARITKIID